MGKIQLRLLGIIAVSLIVIGLAALWFGATQPLFAIMLRVGFGLFAIWLALPQLLRGEWRASLLVIIGLLGLLVLLASRPRLFPIIGGILLLAGLVQLTLRYLSRMLGVPQSLGQQRPGSANRATSRDKKNRSD
ncbi:MAG: hypothetical protein ACKO81_06815 [Planctomycetota bacterium]